MLIIGIFCHTQITAKVSELGSKVNVKYITVGNIFDGRCSYLTK